MFLRFPGGKFKAVTLSFDDGIKQDIKFSEIITKYGIKCTFNINSDKVGNESNRLTAQEIKEHLIDKGHEIAVHGANHKTTGLVRTEEGIKDVYDCRLALENMFDTIIRGMAYPNTGICRFTNGNTYEKVKSYLESLGIVYARSLRADNNSFELPSDWHNWIPSMHWLNPEAPKYIEEFLAIEKHIYETFNYPRLLYIWGHSYECDRDGGKWDLLEEMCQKLSNKEDIWYATNIEIYDYVTAYNSLVISLDGKRIYNPTTTEIWFESDGKLYKIDPDETLKIGL